jgi:hypothetical protein
VRLPDFSLVELVVFEPIVGDAIRVCGRSPAAICKCMANSKLAQSNVARFGGSFQTE